MLLESTGQGTSRGFEEKGGLERCRLFRKIPVHNTHSFPTFFQCVSLLALAPPKNFRSPLKKGKNDDSPLRHDDREMHSKQQAYTRIEGVIVSAATAAAHAARPLLCRHCARAAAAAPPQARDAHPRFGRQRRRAAFCYNCALPRPCVRAFRRSRACVRGSVDGRRPRVAPVARVSDKDEQGIQDCI